jgi:hypothetical protein
VPPVAAVAGALSWHWAMKLSQPLASTLAPGLRMKSAQRV